jgi:flagellar hook-basal body complex protein FliE
MRHLRTAGAERKANRVQLPPKNASSAVCLSFGDAVLGAIEAWSDAETLTSDQQHTVIDLGKTIQPAVDKLRDSSQGSERAARAAIKARARLRVRDVILDMAVMRLSDVVLNGPAGRSREHPIYQQIFRGTTAGKITSAKVREEPALVERLLARLDDAPDFEGKAPARAALANALKKSFDALDAVDDAEAAENSAVDAELSARLALRLALEQTYGALRAAFPGLREFVESFFPKRESEKDAADPTPEAPTGGNAGESKPQNPG